MKPLVRRPPPLNRARQTEHGSSLESRYGERPSPIKPLSMHDVRSLVDEAVEGIFRTSPEGRYLYANHALAAMYKYDSVQELMLSMTNIGSLLYVDPQRRQFFRMLMERQDTVSGFEAEVRCKDLSTIWVREKARVVRHDDGTVAWYEGFVEDITQERLRRDRLGCWERSGLSSPHAISLVTGHGALIHANPAFHSLFAAQVPVSFQQLIALATPASQAAEPWRETRTAWVGLGIAFHEHVSLALPGAEPRSVHLSVHPVERALLSGPGSESVVTLVCL